MPWTRLVAAALLCAAPLLAQKRAFTIEDLYRITNVDQPQISPDGRRIAFVQRVDYLAEGRSNADIMLMDSDGKHQRQLTTHKGSDQHPRWSPDGSCVLFLSTRKDGNQVWTIPMAGGEPEQLTTFPGGVGDAAWSPDGKMVAFTADVFPECGADADCNSRIEEKMSTGPLQAYMSDSLLYRHWDSWKQGKRTHLFVMTLATRSVVDVTPGDFDSPSYTSGTPGFSWSPTGTELCVVSNRGGREAENTNNDLWLVPASGGKAVCITPGNTAYDGAPQYSPDGRYIAYRTQKVPFYEADRFRLALYDRTSGRSRIITEEFDYWVTTYAWAPDSKSLFFLADVRGHTPLYRVTVDAPAVEQVLDHKAIDDFSLSPDGRWMAYTRRSVGEPREIWQHRFGGNTPKRMTFANADLERAVDFRPAEEVWIPSPTGKKIHTFIVKPHNFDPSKKYPLIVNVHGGPQMQWADAFRGDWQVYPGAGYIVAFPNPHGSTGYGQEFTLGISKDWGGKVYQDVMAVTDSLSRLPWVDADRMGAMGWSYGGYMMMWLEGHTNRFKALASMMGVYDLRAMHGATEELWFPEFDLGGTPWESPLYERWSPSNFVSKFATPCLVITGERDYRVPYTQSLEFFTDLQKRNVPSRLIVFKNDGHWPNGVRSMPLYYNAHLDWFHRYLGGGPAPYDMVKMLRNQLWE